MTLVSESPAWLALINEKKRLKFQGFTIAKHLHQNTLVTDGSNTQTFCIDACGLHLDYAKHWIESRTVELLLSLAEQQEFDHHRHALQAGHKVNISENRAALHSLLRAPSLDFVSADLDLHWHAKEAVLSRMEVMCDKLHNGHWLGATDKPITDVINIGVGGSHLPLLAVHAALTDFHLPDIRCHFLANACPNNFRRITDGLDPETTLCIVATKSFSTHETLANADLAKHWFEQAMPSCTFDTVLAKHFIAATQNTDAAQAWGVNVEHCLPVWPSIGGRFSVWSAMGLVLGFALGFPAFMQLLKGAHAMDTHFFNAQPNRNMPLIMALLSVWYHSIWGLTSFAVVPYSHPLRYFSDYLQQLAMESGGKHATQRNELVDYPTCPSLFGGEGNNVQHAFFQHLHQGTHETPVDFIAVLDTNTQHQQQQQWLVASCFAQSRALMLGKSSSGEKAHNAMPGNKPSSTLLLPQLSAETIGSLLALYEHKTFCESILWETNAFDQPGVELGKHLSNEVFTCLSGEPNGALDPSTNRLIERYLTRHHSPRY